MFLNQFPKKKRLSVNIDHIATLREARKTSYPSLLNALAVLEITGVYGVTFHLREDRRHIQNEDVFVIKNYSQFLASNFEAAATADIIDFALTIKPNRITLVPEKRVELTTETGLDLFQIDQGFIGHLNPLKKAEIPICFFIDPDIKSIKKAQELEIQHIELNTAHYSQCEKDSAQQKKSLIALQEASEYAKSLNMKVYAGHGLHIYNVENIINIPEIEELNIGHGIIARAIFLGLEKAIKEIQALL